MDLKEEIKREDFPDYYLRVADVIGLDMAVQLSEKIGGTAMYVPIFKRCTARARNRSIREEFSTGRT